MNGRSELVERALGYPYPTPPRSFLLVGEESLDLGAVEVDLSTRSPLLAYGSNAAPATLARKLSATPEPVAAIRAELADFDVVYSAHLATYGSVPATLWRSPGTRVSVHVLYLTGEQLRLLSETEPNYELGRLDDISCRLETGETLERLPAYLSRHGCLLVAGTAAALTAIPARGRRLPALSQRRAIKHVRNALRPGEDLERFIAAAATGAIPAPEWQAGLARGLAEPRAFPERD